MYLTNAVHLKINSWFFSVNGVCSGESVELRGLIKLTVLSGANCD